MTEKSQYVLVDVAVASPVPILEEDEDDSCDCCACCWLTHICARMTIACCYCMFATAKI
jgi:hypothetical protein